MKKEETNTKKRTSDSEKNLAERSWKKTKREKNEKRAKRKDVYEYIGHCLIDLSILSDIYY